MYNSQYNYQKSLRERDVAVQSEKLICKILLAVLFVSAILLILVLRQKVRTAEKALQLHRALDLVGTLQRNITNLQNGCHTDPSDPTTLSEITRINQKFDSATNLRAQIRAELQKLESGAVKQKEISIELVQSRPCLVLKQYIMEEKGVSTSDSLWQELAQEVEKMAPNFRQKLETLTSGRLSESDFQIALLIKCNISPTGMAILLNKTKSTVSTRRAFLSQKMFGENLGAKTTDNIIRLL